MLICARTKERAQVIAERHGLKPEHWEWRNMEIWEAPNEPVGVWIDEWSSIEARRELAKL